MWGWNRGRTHLLFRDKVIDVEREETIWRILILKRYKDREIEIGFKNIQDKRNIRYKPVSTGFLVGPNGAPKWSKSVPLVEPMRKEVETMVSNGLVKQLLRELSMSFGLGESPDRMDCLLSDIY